MEIEIDMTFKHFYVILIPFVAAVLCLSPWQSHLKGNRYLFNHKKNIFYSIFVFKCCQLFEQSSCASGLWQLHKEQRNPVKMLSCNTAIQSHNLNCMQGQRCWYGPGCHQDMWGQYPMFRQIREYPFFRYWKIRQKNGPKMAKNEKKSKKRWHLNRLQANSLFLALA